MANIGNEAKLILKLAKERAEKRKCELLSCGALSTSEQAAYTQAHSDWLGILDQVVTELEKK